MFKFIHAADLHLDSPLRGLARYEGAPTEELRGATRQALEGLIRIAIEEAVTFVLFAGDIYDGDWRDYNTGLFFGSQMSKLRQAGIKVFLISGNHDAQSQITKTIHLPENVRQLSTRKAETVRLDDLEVAIHGRGFSKRAVTEDISETYPAAMAGYFNIGMLHTSATGREGHEPYAPCTTSGLSAKGYDYWALGHVHKREVLCEDPWIVFSGNIQGRHIREQGVKGCSIVTVKDSAVCNVEHRGLDVVRWHHVQVDATDVQDGDEILEKVGEAVQEKVEEDPVLLHAIRVTLHGRCNAHTELQAQPDHWINQIRAVATDNSNGKAWIEKVKIQTKAKIDLERIQAREDAVSGLLQSLASVDSMQKALEALEREFTSLKNKLPVELQGSDEALNLDSPAKREDMLAEVQQILIPRFLSGEDLG